MFICLVTHFHEKMHFEIFYNVWSRIGSKNSKNFVLPLTANSSATAKKLFRESWATFTSPWYMKFNTAWSSFRRMPFRYKSGFCWCLWWANILRNKGLHAASITLWAWTKSTPLSQQSVTSKNSLSSRNSRKLVLMFDSKSFHRRQKLSDDPMMIVYVVLNFQLITGLEKPFVVKPTDLKKEEKVAMSILISLNIYAILT